MAKQSKEEVVRNALELTDQIRAAIAALETETEPEKVLNHVGSIRDLGRINALRSVLQERSIELFRAKGLIK